MQDLSFYFENWNTNMVSISAVICLVLTLSGYFYGKIFQKYIKPLKDIDCTFLGVIFIFAVFQIFVFFAIPMETEPAVAMTLLGALVIISPLLCLITWSNPLPNLHNLFGLLTGLLVCIVLGKTSAGLNTNNIYFDSIHYLSAVLENSTQNIFARMNYYNGVYNYSIDPLHDFEGYVYFWGVVLRWVDTLFKVEESMTPVYIWGASFVYWMGLGNLIYSSAAALFKKWWKIPGLIALILLVSPYYTNYWNTTLAFFGNSLRTVIIGFSILVGYLYLKSKNGYLFLINMLCVYAAIFASSSGFFLEAFILAGLFFCMTWLNEEKLSSYVCFILSFLPIVHYMVVVLTQYYRYYWQAMRIVVIPIAVLLLIAFLVRKHFDMFNKIMRWLFPAAALGLMAVSFLKRNSNFPYSFFFTPRSHNDMCNNFTSFFEERDMMRNIILYVMLACLLIRPKVEKEFKLFLLIVGVLFINPLVQPAVSNYMTSGVYSRVFDIIVNPFTLAFLLANIHNVLESEKYSWLKYLSLVPMAALAFVSYPLGKENIDVPYTNNLIFKEDGFDWETKVAPDSWDLYNWIDYNIYRSSEDKPVFLSQDISLKGYVSNIEMAFSSSDNRDAMDKADLFEQHKKMLSILYPEKRYAEEEVNGVLGDYNDLSEVLQEYKAEYLVIRNTIAVWDDRGWYNKSYQPVLNNGQCKVIYENDTWALLKVDPEWTPEPAEDSGEELIG